MFILYVIFIFQCVLCEEINDSSGVCRNYDNSPLLCKFCGSELTHRHNYKFIISELSKSTRDYRDICPAIEIQYFQHPDSHIDYGYITFDSVEPLSIINSNKPTAYASFYPSYVWEEIRCSKCNTIVGKKFSEPDYEKAKQVKRNIRQNQIPEEELLSMFPPPIKNETEFILNRFKECLIYKMGYWHYEYCPNRGIHQYHPDAKEPTRLNLSLGRYIPFYHKDNNIKNKEKTGSIGVIMDEELSQMKTNSNSNSNSMFGRLFYREMYENGEICEETNMKRKTEVRIIYCGNGENEIKQVKEMSLCNYRITVCFNELEKLERYKYKIDICPYCNKPFLIKNNVEENQFESHKLDCIGNDGDKKKKRSSFYAFNMENVIFEDDELLDFITEPVNLLDS